MSKQIMVQDTLVRELDLIRASYNCSYTKAIQLYASGHASPRARINELYDEIKRVIFEAYPSDGEMQDLVGEMSLSKARCLKAMTEREAQKVMPGQEDLL